MDWRGRLGVDDSGSKVDPDAVRSSSLASSSVGSNRYISVKLDAGRGKMQRRESESGLEGQKVSGGKQKFTQSLLAHIT
jgi:hypothetical protein